MEEKRLEEIMRVVQEEDVEFIRLQFTDMSGSLKNIAITADQLLRVFVNPFPIEEREPDGKRRKLYLLPDLDTFAILPWRPQTGKVARFLCDIVDDAGESWENSSREILRKVVRQAKKEGYTFFVKPECEFFLFHTDENGLPTSLTHERAGYLDVSPIDLGENARRDMVLALKEMGLPVESSHHEVGPGQHEIDIQETTAFQAADRIVTMRMAVRAIAKRHGLHATFMPKPKTGVEGSGMHMQIELWKDGKNVFEDEKLQEAFMAGIANRIEETAVFANPTVNSYRRLRENSHLTDNPVIQVKTWKALKDRAAVEVQTADGTANPYVLLALFLEAGLLGLRKGEKKKALSFPRNLGVAIEKAEKKDFARTVLGKKFVKEYLTARKEEWDSYERQVTAWETEAYLHRM
ncbi:MAG: glutamine synthetase family protein [bacterium]|nr:glutamine synthetase family protein [bacterium]